MINQQVNLFQPIFRIERKLLSFRVLQQGIGVVFLLLVLMFGWSWMQTSQMQTDVAQIQKRLNSRTAAMAELKINLASMKTDTAPMQELDRLEQELTARQKVVSAITRVRETYTRGVSGYLESFSRQTPEGIWLTSFSVQAGGDGLVIRGSSLKPNLVPAFLQKLSDESIMAGTRFGLLQIQREEPESRSVDFTVYTGNKPPKEVAP